MRILSCACGAAVLARGALSGDPPVCAECAERPYREPARPYLSDTANAVAEAALDLARARGAVASASTPTEILIRSRQERAAARTLEQAARADALAQARWLAGLHEPEAIVPRKAFPGGTSGAHLERKPPNFHSNRRKAG